ncbi:hypothetical protein [Novosphingobium sp. JCM 18896]|uniref:hypothetical protein n=1 Tax=Novosphingobium sp. JCM 18896 TaxID=2989731 RepID=UPI002223A862|nr:hypothetical protein [Novosphingobium sp. JCM 18896]MCW1432248.1 hypothetical protein [Novosphingobium sp. JCM 18896]
MAKWIKCTALNSPDHVIYVNLDQVVSISGSVKGGGSVITYAGGETNQFVVNEAPAFILQGTII